jgi:acetylornithine deacetylase/succinyl-diaminopimelate desuccinylase-like protein
VGIKHLLSRGLRADMALVGEPTSLKVVLRHFGTSWIRIDVKAAPSSTTVLNDLTRDLQSPSGTSATEQVAELASAVQEWIPDYRRRNSVDGLPPMVRIGGVESGPPWQFASTGSLFLYINTPPGAPQDSALQEVRQLLADVRGKRPKFDAEAKLYSVNPGPVVSEDHPLVEAVRAAHQSVFGKPPTQGPVQFYSDASPLVARGIPAINYGPAGMIKFDTGGTPEGTGEFMRIRDLVEYARVCAALILQVCD